MVDRAIEIAANMDGNTPNKTASQHMHNSLVAWFRCTPGTRKRFLAGIDRQALNSVW